MSAFSLDIIGLPFWAIPSPSLFEHGIYFALKEIQKIDRGYIVFWKIQLTCVNVSLLVIKKKKDCGPLMTVHGSLESLYKQESDFVVLNVW
jgi:hypothetical protein